MPFRSRRPRWRGGWFKTGVIATWIAVAPSSALALTVTPLNHATDTTIAGTRTIVFPIAGNMCGATSQHTFPRSLTGLDPSGTTTGLRFNITTDKDLTTMNGGSAPDSDDISLRVEHTTTNLDKIALDDEGLGYSVSNSAYYVKYGQVSGVTQTIGISLGDNPNGTTAQGYCNYISATLGVDCDPGAGVTPATTPLKFGVVKTGNNFSTSSNDDISEQINIIVTDCPAGSSSGVITEPTLNFSIIAGDQRVKIVNIGTAPTDYSGLGPKSVVVIGESSSTQPTVNSSVQQEFGTLTGTYTVEGLQNDVRYCFSLGYVNNAGFMTTNTGWGDNMPTLSSDAHCATPSQIDGFLNRSTCFIASAAYGEEWDSRLEILRQFRDQVLERSAAGRAFVRWYYDWSPSASHWLREHPGITGMVKVALVPVVEGAKAALWLRGNMWALALLFIVATGTLVVGRLRRA